MTCMGGLVLKYLHFGYVLRSVVVVVNLILCNGIGINGVNEEGAALLSFKASMREDPYGSLANWNSSDPTPCAWNGVTCNKGGNVVSLTLVRNSLKGPLTMITSLPSLRRVNLRNNRLLGNIPPALFRSSPSLHTLVLSMNSLSGPLPPDLKTTTTLLRVLDLSHNSLRGSFTFTHQCSCCSRLRTLILSHNNFTGPLPPALGNTFTSLERIDLSYNSFTGSIPRDIGNLSSLDSTADFSHNLFSGPVPASLGSLPERVYVDLSYNNLTGAIPQSGSLANRGPTAFAGNPGLCGPPLKNACMVLPPAGSKGGTSNVSDVTLTSSRRLSRSVVNAIIVGDLVGIAVVATVFCYLYRRRRRAASSKETGKKGSLRKGLMAKECFCLREGEADSSNSRGNLGQTNLIPLDRKVNFSLNELLQSTAFVLGKSEFGIVYKVVMGDRSTLAVRRLGEGGSQRFNEFQREVEAIGRVRHSNIVALRAYYWSIEEKLLIYDYIPGGNLSAAIHGRDGDSTFSPLLWSSRLKIMKGVAKGLAFLHESSPKKYVHGDLKPRNVLLGLNMMPYISDFGLGRLAYIAEGSAPERAQNQFSDAAVSPVTSSRLCYHAPEAFRSTKPSQKWDIYSFGVILLELISGQSPVLLLDTQEMDLVKWFQFCISERKPLVDVLDPYLAQEPEIEDEIITVLKIALACVESNPERRPPMKLVSETLERSITRS